MSILHEPTIIRVSEISSNRYSTFLSALDCDDTSSFSGGKYVYKLVYESGMASLLEWAHVFPQLLASAFPRALVWFSLSDTAPSSRLESRWSSRPVREWPEQLELEQDRAEQQLLLLDEARELPRAVPLELLYISRKNNDLLHAFSQLLGKKSMLLTREHNSF